ncbi:MAG: hypothetical protein ABIP17_15360 [Ilumatobacteraceae bacterium]
MSRRTFTLPISSTRILIAHLCEVIAESASARLGSAVSVYTFESSASVIGPSVSEGESVVGGTAQQSRPSATQCTRR